MGRGAFTEMTLNFPCCATCLGHTRIGLGSMFQSGCVKPLLARSSSQLLLRFSRSQTYIILLVIAFDREHGGVDRQTHSVGGYGRRE